MGGRIRNSSSWLLAQFAEVVGLTNKFLQKWPNHRIDQITSSDLLQSCLWNLITSKNFLVQSCGLKIIRNFSNCCSKVLIASSFRTGLKEIMKIFSNRSSKILIARIFRTGLKNSRQTLQIFTATYYGLQVFSERDTKIMRNFSNFLQQGTELHAFSEMDSKFMTNFSNVRSEVLIVSIFRTGLKIQ